MNCSWVVFCLQRLIVQLLTLSLKCECSTDGKLILKILYQNGDAFRLPDAGVTETGGENESMEQGSGGPMVDVSFLDAAAKLDKEMEQYENEVEVTTDHAMMKDENDDTIDSVCVLLFSVVLYFKKKILPSVCRLFSPRVF